MCRYTSYVYRVLLFNLLAAPSLACAYGPLTHSIVVYVAREQTLDAVAKFSKTASHGDRSTLLAASMAGALLHDIGYVDPKLRPISDLLHYQGTGSFIQRYFTVTASRNHPVSTAFGFGLLSHYSSDREGHYWATNRIAAELLKQTPAVGSRYAYEDNESAHTCIEYRLDLLSVMPGELLSQDELDEFVSILDRLAGLIQGESGYFQELLLPSIIQTLSLTYGIAVQTLAQLGVSQANYGALVFAYQTMLKQMATALRAAESTYNLKIDYSKLRFFPQLIKTAYENLPACVPEKAPLEHFVATSGVFIASRSKSVELYTRYIRNMMPVAAGNQGTVEIWHSNAAPADVNLDTNLVSGAHEYRQAQSSMEYLEKDNAGNSPPAFLKEYQSVGACRSTAYFRAAELHQVAKQVIALDKLERDANAVTSPGRAVGTALPPEMPKFQFLKDGDSCPGTRVLRLTQKAQLLVSSQTVCLPPDATIVEAWIGALAANAPKIEDGKWEQLYRETCYAYFSREPSHHRSYAAACGR